MHTRSDPRVLSAMGLSKEVSLSWQQSCKAIHHRHQCWLQIQATTSPRDGTNCWIARAVTSIRSTRAQQFELKKVRVLGLSSSKLENLKNKNMLIFILIYSGSFISQGGDVASCNFAWQDLFLALLELFWSISNYCCTKSTFILHHVYKLEWGAMMSVGFGPPYS